MVYRNTTRKFIDHVRKQYGAQSVFVSCQLADYGHNRDVIVEQWSITIFNSPDTVIYNNNNAPSLYVAVKLALTTLDADTDAEFERVMETMV